MLGKEFAELVWGGVFPVVFFKEDILNQEGYLEPGMRGRLTGVRNDGKDVLIFTLDLSEFEDHNRALESASFFDKNMQPTLTAREAGHYKVKMDLYVDTDLEACMEVEEPHRLQIFQMYQEAKPGIPYTMWLEDQVAHAFNQVQTMREMF